VLLLNLKHASMAVFEVLGFDEETKKLQLRHMVTDEKQELTKPQCRERGYVPVELEAWHAVPNSKSPYEASKLQRYLHKWYPSQEIHHASDPR
jgi:hypothetical protein